MLNVQVDKYGAVVAMHHSVVAHPRTNLAGSRCPIWLIRPRSTKIKPGGLTQPPSERESGKYTHHLRLLPPRTKSILVHSFVTFGDHPVKVAKLAETLNLGVSARVSKNLKSGSWFPPGVYVSVNLLSTRTGGTLPVTTP